MSTKHLTGILGCLLVGASLWGCATTPVPTARVAAAKAAIRASEEVGAAENPRAALHLRLGA